MDSMIKRTLSTAALLAMAVSASAADPLHNSTWQTIDDETGKPKAVIKITDNGGKLEGHLQKAYAYKATDPCKKCVGKYKDKPLKGAKIFWGLKPSGKNKYEGGKIFDPKKGKDYKLKGKLINNGKTFELRGYVGTPLLGRTQKWKRLK